MPALFTSTSRRPNSRFTWAKSSATEPGSRTSVATDCTVAPWVPGAGPIVVVRVRLASTTEQPTCASSPAMALPMPRLAPVTTATLPFHGFRAAVLPVMPLRAIGPATNQGQELLARLLLVTKHAEHRRCDRRPVV